MQDSVTAREVNDYLGFTARSPHTPVSGLPEPEEVSQSTRLLLVLQGRGTPVFAGIPASERARRRAVGKRQRQGRRAAR